MPCMVAISITYVCTLVPKIAWPAVKTSMQTWHTRRQAVRELTRLYGDAPMISSRQSSPHRRFRGRAFLSTGKG